jgi:hypothetical protein
MATIQTGIHELKARFRLWNWLYVVKLGLALVFTLPVLAVVSAKVDYSSYAAPLLETWSFDVIYELIGTSPDLAPVLIAVLLFYGLAAFLIGQFLNGGIYSSFLSDRPLRLREFFAEAASLFRMNMKVSLLMLPVYVTLFLVAGTIAEVVPSDLFGHFGLATVGGLGVRVALMYVAFIFGSAFSQILRLFLTADPNVPVLKIIRPAVDFYLRRAVKLNGIYFLYFVPFVLIWLLAEYVGASVAAALGSVAGVMIEMFLFQACSWLRTGQSLAFTATAAPLVKAAFCRRLGTSVGETSLD